MIKSILYWINPKHWVKKKQNDLTKLAFYKPDPILRPSLVNKLVTFTKETVRTEKELIEEAWQLINWSRVSIEAKKQILNIAKADIKSQIDNFNPIK